MYAFVIHDRQGHFEIDFASGPTLKARDEESVAAILASRGYSEDVISASLEAGYHIVPVLVLSAEEQEEFRGLIDKLKHQDDSWSSIARGISLSDDAPPLQDLYKMRATRAQLALLRRYAADRLKKPSQSEQSKEPERSARMPSEHFPAFNTLVEYALANDLTTSKDVWKAAGFSGPDTFFSTLSRRQVGKKPLDTLRDWFEKQGYDPDKILEAKEGQVPLEKARLSDDAETTQKKGPSPEPNTLPLVTAAVNWIAKHYGLNQGDAAEAMGIPRATLYSGKSKNHLGLATGARAEDALRRLKVSPEAVMKGDPDKVVPASQLPDLGFPKKFFGTEPAVPKKETKKTVQLEAAPEPEAASTVVDTADKPVKAMSFSEALEEADRRYGALLAILRKATEKAPHFEPVKKSLNDLVESLVMIHEDYWSAEAPQESEEAIEE